jgi:vacuolar-type H+-ATPase subunit I/STV1
MLRSSSKVWEDFFRPPPGSSQEISQEIQPLPEIKITENIVPPEKSSEENSSENSPEENSSENSPEDNQEEIEMIFAHLDEDLFAEHNTTEIAIEANKLVTKLEELPESPHEEIEEMVRDVSKGISSTLQRRITLRTVLQVVSLQADNVEEKLRASMDVNNDNL